MVDVQNAIEDFKRVNAQVVLAAMSSVENLYKFHQRFQLSFPCLSDPDAKLYRAFDVPRGNLKQIAGPSVWGKAIRALWRTGFGVPRGDLRQLQATLVIDTRGIIRYAHQGKNSADNPSNAELLQAISSL